MIHNMLCVIEGVNHLRLCINLQCVQHGLMHSFTDPIRLCILHRCRYSVYFMLPQDGLEVFSKKLVAIIDGG